MANDWNDAIIKEFRTNGGNVASFAKQPLVLLHTTGAKSGQPRINPLAVLAVDDKLYVFASYAGRPEHPAWYFNLKANPTVAVELGEDRFDAVATEVTGADRDRIYAQQASVNPGFAEYALKTTRKIPVIALTRV